ncbi:hypothetical protein ACFVVA_41975 [Kitasatospora sp. NPDC058048]|uniref:hypothetical protein n=1 Tax=Kitasatospora sp. NPDC058048 TaxID=3346313 RepID=UPI0036D8A60E
MNAEQPRPDQHAAATGTLVTEYAFTLPRGLVDDSGAVHRDGRMRLATARDELAPLVDQRVRDNPAYLGIVLLSLVVTELGSRTAVRPEDIERLFAEDLAYLQELYQRINGDTGRVVTCPGCGTRIATGGGAPGES